MKAEDLVRQIEERLGTLAVHPEVANMGRVISVADGIVRADGLSRAGYGELVEFEDGRRGLIMNLDEDFASILVLSEDTSVPEGMEIRSTARRSPSRCPRICSAGSSTRSEPRWTESRSASREDRSSPWRESRRE